jgi:hypothetical protein
MRLDNDLARAHVADGAQREVANDFDNVIEMKRLA